MTLRMLLEPAENVNADLVRYSGALGGSGTAWGIDAKRPSRWSVESEPGVIRVQYDPPGMRLIIR